MTLYREGDRADAVFNLSNGVVKSYKRLDGAEHIVGFLFPGDLVGLAEEGTYTNSVEAATEGDQIDPVVALETMMRQPLWNFTLSSSFVTSCARPNAMRFC